MIDEKNLFSNGKGGEGLISLSAARALEPSEMSTYSAILREMRLQLLRLVLLRSPVGWTSHSTCFDGNCCLFVLNGRLRVTVGAVTRNLMRGECAIIPVLTEYHLESLDGNAEWYLAQFLTAAPITRNPFSGFSSPFLQANNVEGLEADLQAVAALQEQDYELAALHMAGIIRHLMLGELQKGRFVLRGNNVKDMRIRDAIAYMRLHYRENIHIADLAAAAHLGEVRFRTLFRQNLRIAPSDYLLLMRVWRAADSMIRDNLEIKEAALANGFTNASYFCTAFRRILHMRPSEYRRRFRVRKGILE